jgi:hypothetical protein
MGVGSIFRGLTKAEKEAAALAKQLKRNGVAKEEIDRTLSAHALNKLGAAAGRKQGSSGRAGWGTVLLGSAGVGALWEGPVKIASWFISLPQQLEAIKADSDAKQLTRDNILENDPEGIEPSQSWGDRAKQRIGWVKAQGRQTTDVEKALLDKSEKGKAGKNAVLSDEEIEKLSNVQLSREEVLQLNEQDQERLYKVKLAKNSTAVQMARKQADNAEAAAKKQEIETAVFNESLEDLQGKIDKHIPLNTAENARYIELKTNQARQVSAEVEATMSKFSLEAIQAVLGMIGNWLRNIGGEFFGINLA